MLYRNRRMHLIRPELRKTVVMVKKEIKKKCGYATKLSIKKTKNSCAEVLKIRLHAN